MAQKKNKDKKSSKGEYNFIAYWIILAGIVGFIVIFGSRYLVGGVLG